MHYIYVGPTASKKFRIRFKKTTVIHADPLKHFNKLNFIPWQQFLIELNYHMCINRTFLFVQREYRHFFSKLQRSKWWLLLSGFWCVFSPGFIIPKNCSTSVWFWLPTTDHLCWIVVTGGFVSGSDDEDWADAQDVVDTVALPSSQPPGHR